MIQSVTVFCGSADNCPQLYLQEAYRTGQAIARRGLRLVYGSGSWGSMGQVALGAQAEGGYVTGINVQCFADSDRTLKVDEYMVEPTMQTRKMRLIEYSDASIAIPGGVGTLDEITEIFAQVQLGLVKRPFGMLNTNHYFDGFLLQLERAHADHFLKDKDYARLMVAEDIDMLLDMLNNYDEVYEKRLRELQK